MSERASPYVVLEFASTGGTVRRLSFREPAEVVTARHVTEVVPALERVQAVVDAGRFAAGFVSYEAAPAFDPAMVTHPAGDLPLVWFGLFDSVDESSVDTANREQAGRRDREPAATSVAAPELSVSRHEHAAAVTRIREAIGRGELYQVNYTAQARLQNDAGCCSAQALYRRLAQSQAGGYRAWINLGPVQIASASPELFFEMWPIGDGRRRVTMRPMKGTAPRGRWREDDIARADALRSSAKERAENLMIVDLVRNDLGRIAEIGSVECPALFALERYPTLWQMTSTVTAILPASAALRDVFRATFPCGSVTGAPKVQAMRMIRELEAEPRGIYCGAIGWAGPGGAAQFNVAIRTAVVDKVSGTARFGVGSGITWDSSADAEYAEVMSKAMVATSDEREFELLESLRLERGRYSLLEAHVARLMRSAEYFGVPVTDVAVRHELYVCAAGERADSDSVPYKVRLLVSRAGRIRSEIARLDEPAPGPLEVALAPWPVDSACPMLYHKTTRRDIFEAAVAARPDVFDVLMWNERGELTEFTRGNLAVENEEGCWTPPVDCGLLPGTLRAELLANGALSERVMRPGDLVGARRILWINSVRGSVAVRMTGVDYPPATVAPEPGPVFAG